MTRPVTLADLGATIDAIVRGLGGIPERERPYYGRRSGWYPARPARRRKAAR